MSVLQSIFLGIVQGITEFLPVSSSGHLAIFKHIFHLNTDGGMLFDILLHVGTLLVVLIVFRRDIGMLILEALRMIGDMFFNLRTLVASGKGEKGPMRSIVRNNYRKFVILIIVSTIPTGIIGILGKDLVEQAGSTLLVPGICLLITGAVLYLTDRTPEGDKMPKDVTYREAIIIGVAQGIATLPGISRSGATIAACIFLGLDRRFSLKYSFILSIPAILGAAVLELKDLAGATLTAGETAVYLAGMLFAALTGYICIRTMLLAVRKKKLSYFAWYCFAAGIVAIAGHFLL